MSRRSRIKGIIVEGHDCSGKSSLVEHLRKMLASDAWDIQKLAHKDGDQFTRYMRTYVAADRLLLDRSHFSEVVYSRLHRGGPAMTGSELSTLNRVAREEFVTVLCTASPSKLLARYRARTYAQPPTSVAEIESARAGFIESVAAHASAIYESDVHGSLEHTLRVVAECLASDRRRARATLPRTAAEVPSFILVEGVDRETRVALVRSLASRLPGWRIDGALGGAGGTLFDHEMARYLWAERAVLDGGHFVRHAVAGKNSNLDLSAEQATCLAEYLARRALVLYCAPAAFDGAGRRTPEHVHHESARAWAAVTAALPNAQRVSLDEGPAVDSLLNMVAGLVGAA